MAPRIVVSYDGTPDDEDALMLGKVFAELGCPVALAYVRHSHLEDAAAEAREARAAADLLARGAQELGGGAETYVLFDPSTSAALAALIQREGFEVIVFGSSYRTPAGHIAPGRAASQLLDGGPAAVGVAPAGYRDETPKIEKVALVPSGSDDGANRTAESFGTEVVAAPNRDADLIVFGSRPGTSKGRVSLSAANEQLAEEAAACPVLVVASETPLDFSS